MVSGSTRFRVLGWRVLGFRVLGCGVLGLRVLGFRVYGSGPCAAKYPPPSQQPIPAAPDPIPIHACFTVLTRP